MSNMEKENDMVIVGSNANTGKRSAKCPVNIVLDNDCYRPKIVCLCGSGKFHEAIDTVNQSLTLAGYIVLAPGVFWYHNNSGHLSEEGVQVKARLDVLHLRKIDLADEVRVVDVANFACPFPSESYIGESTQKEIDYAQAQGKPVFFASGREAIVPNKS